MYPARRQLYRVGGIKHHRAARLAHDRQTAHIRNQVVVTEAHATFTHHNVVAAAIGFPGLVDDILHVARRQELAFLDIHRLAGARYGMDEISLTAQESRVCNTSATAATGSISSIS